MYANQFCNNCGIKGHLFHQCKLPITSVGRIAYKKVDGEFKFLMIRRKDSLGYVDFMRGKYSLTNKMYLLNIINEMTLYEKASLLTISFDDLWQNLWGDYITNQYKNEKVIAYEKFRMLKGGIIIDDKYYTLQSLVDESTSSWTEPEWGFPKGRRNYMETDIKCATREFTEETGYSMGNVKIITNLYPYEEIFIGSNYKSYKHIYYLAIADDADDLDDSDNFQTSEVSKIEFKTFEQATNSIRHYNIERIETLSKINQVLMNFEIK